MSTSGTTTMSATRNTIILRALRLVAAYASGESPKDEEITDANTALNMMIKSWQIQNFLWLKEFHDLTMIAGTVKYTLPGDDIDFKPTRVFSANRKLTDGQEVPLEPLGRDDYAELTNKTVSGVPVQYYFDPQRNTADFYVWPAPQTGTTDVIVIDIDRPLQVMIDSDDDFDFPEEWLEPISYGLAVRIAPEFSVPLNERVLLDKTFGSLADNLLNYNADNVSTRFGVRYD